MSSVADKKTCEWQQTVLGLLSNLKTRDAMYRVVQFSLRVVLAVRSICAATPQSAGLFARLVASVAPKSALDAKLMSAVAALATGRKVLAFGNVVAEVPNLHRLVSSLSLGTLILRHVSCFLTCEQHGHGTALNTCSLSAETVLPVVRSLCMINFWLFDHASWLSGGARVLSASPARLSVTQSRFWLAAVLCSIVLDTRALNTVISKLERAPSTPSTPRLSLSPFFHVFVLSSHLFLWLQCLQRQRQLLCARCATCAT